MFILALLVALAVSRTNGQTTTTTTSTTTVSTTTVSASTVTVVSTTVTTATNVTTGSTTSQVSQMCTVVNGIDSTMLSYFDNTTGLCYVVAGADRVNYSSTVQKCTTLETSADGNWTCRVPQIDEPTVINRLPTAMQASYYFIGLTRPSCNDSWQWTSGTNSTSAYAGNFSVLAEGDECTYNNYVISTTGVTPATSNDTTETLCECGLGINGSLLPVSRVYIIAPLLLILHVFSLLT
ncbi:unnamed protein product [Bursaphelenchus okinawaensis]|uniref:C-type lectin domain-containing protein n=1 Tax=Bursaphelenchus okinawaensis TaxID=465554 RepID=A0A811LWG8_9BILA|nr:unnamed protein product [Bursaphelenchus okinawaensis]CAG9128399.1 unnamed protein product [Bursaphelenchus okinawaensis]